MNKPHQPAFPILAPAPACVTSVGLSKREYLAAEIVSGAAAAVFNSSLTNADLRLIAKRSVVLADYFIAELDKKSAE